MLLRPGVYANTKFTEACDWAETYVGLDYSSLGAGQTLLLKFVYEPDKGQSVMQ